MSFQFNEKLQPFKILTVAFFTPPNSTVTKKFLTELKFTRPNKTYSYPYSTKSEPISTQSESYSTKS